MRLTLRSTLSLMTSTLLEPLVRISTSLVPVKWRPCSCLRPDPSCAGCCLATSAYCARGCATCVRISWVNRAGLVGDSNVLS